MTGHESSVAGITPVVLVGGRSRRFGRDKLREPLADGSWLVDRPITALRAVFGARVMLVGDCDPGVALRGDGMILDRYGGAGPIGGVLSALDDQLRPVFVLAGDLVSIDESTVRRITFTASQDESAWAVLAQTDRIEACIGVYRPPAAAALRLNMRRGECRLDSAAPPNKLHLVPIDRAAARNVNSRADLPDRAAIPNPRVQRTT